MIGDRQQEATLNSHSTEVSNQNKGIVSGKRNNEMYFFFIKYLLITSKKIMKNGSLGLRDSLMRLEGPADGFSGQI
jgi:hypothetical protein